MWMTKHAQSSAVTVPALSREWEHFKNMRKGHDVSYAPFLLSRLAHLVRSYDEAGGSWDLASMGESYPAALVSIYHHGLVDEVRLLVVMSSRS